MPNVLSTEEFLCDPIRKGRNVVFFFFPPFDRVASFCVEITPYGTIYGLTIRGSQVGSGGVFQTTRFGNTDQRSRTRHTGAKFVP